MAAARRNTQDITAASQIRGSFSRDNSPQKKQGKLVERCTAHARERQTSNRKNIPFDQIFWPPLNNGIIWGLGTGWKYVPFVTFFVTFCMQSFLQGKTDKKLSYRQFNFTLKTWMVYICILSMVGDLILAIYLVCMYV